MKKHVFQRLYAHLFEFHAFNDYFYLKIFIHDIKNPLHRNICITYVKLLKIRVSSGHGKYIGLAKSLYCWQ